MLGLPPDAVILKARPDAGVSVYVWSRVCRMYLLGTVVRTTSFKATIRLADPDGYRKLAGSNQYRRYVGKDGSIEWTRAFDQRDRSYCLYSAFTKNDIEFYKGLGNDEEVRS